MSDHKVQITVNGVPGTDEIEARPAAQRAVKLKDRFTFKTENDEEARRNMFRHIKA